MNPQEHARAREVFLAVVSAPPERRDALLAEQCGNDNVLRNEVERLLAHHRKESLGQMPATLVVGHHVVVTEDESPETPETPQRRSFPPGTVIAERYRVVARLGGGGMGDVYRADDLTLKQTVALKFLASDLAHDNEWLEQLHREVRVARTVTHPNVCRVYDIIVVGDEQFISMEYVDGEDLSSLLRRIGRLPHGKALDIAHQLCGGLAAAHAAGVLHRDLKPANVMLDGRGHVRITDFGLAVSAADLKGDQRIVGTPAYMAPEQFARSGVDERTDIYALGLVLYELFTGQPAVTGRSLVELARKHQAVEPTLPSEIVANIDPEVENVIRACIAKNRDERPASVQAVAARLPRPDSLSRVLAAGDTPAPELIAAAAVPHALTRSQQLVALIMALLLLVGNFAMGGRGRFDFNVHNMKAPAVLLEHARAFARTEELPGGTWEAWGYAPSDNAAAALLNSRSMESSTELAHDERNELVFWYRVLPKDYGPKATHPFGIARIALRDPPEDQPGMGTIVLDATGRLIAFTRYPTASSDANAAEAAVDWSRFLAAAHLKEAETSPVAPEMESPTYAETRVAWVCAPHAHDSSEIRIEGAALSGTPLMFIALRDAPAIGGFELGRAQRKDLADNLLRIMLIVTLLAALPLARRNLLRGRGDSQTALRLATIAFGLRLIVWLLSTSHHTLRPGELRLLQDGLFVSAFQGLALGLFYLALEPLARRYWPYALISWSRLVAGRAWDAIVGQHVLLGVLLGILWSALLSADRLIVKAAGLSLRPIVWEELFTLPLLGARYAVALAADMLGKALIYGLLIMLVLALLRALLKKPVPAAIAATVAITLLFLPYGNSSATAWLMIGVGCVATGMWAVVRYGLLTLMTAVFVLGMLSFFPMTFDADSWYSDLTLFAMSAVLALLVFGFMAARRAPASV